MESLASTSDQFTTFHHASTYFALVVPVLEVVCVLPDVEPQEYRQLCELHEVLLLDLGHHERVELLVVAEQRPAGALDRLGGVAELRLELVNSPKVRGDLVCELSAWVASPSLPWGGHVGPEYRVKLVAVDVEAQVPQRALEVDLHRAGPRLLELVERCVRTVHVCLVVLVVVQLHDLLRDVRFQSVVRVW